MRLLNKYLKGRTLKQAFIDSRFHQWLRNDFKPIPLCWWFEKHNLPVPKYLIGHSTFTLSQVAYRFRNDDGTETGATWLAAQNANWNYTITAYKEFRLRIEIQETGGATGTNSATLQYSLNNSTWNTVPTGSGSSPVYITGMTWLADGSATTNQLTAGSGTFTAGQGRTTSTAASSSMAASGQTEHEWGLALDPAQFGYGTTTLYFRTLDSGGTITYSQTALANITKVAPPPIIVPNGQYKSDFTTPALIGDGTGTSGTSANLYLRAGVAPNGSSTTAFTPKLETKQVGTSFNGTATHTLSDRTYREANAWSGRRGATLIYDSHNKRYIMFGGYDGTTRYNDVWEKYVDVPGRAWRKLATTGTPPSGRNLAGAVYVKGNLTSGGAVRAYMVVWGGADPSDKNDMLILRLDTPGSEAWSTVTQTSAPSVRSYMNRHLVSTPVSGASDQNYIYLFGGWAASRENVLVRCTFDVDTPTAVTWTTLKANGAGGNPTARSGAVMDYKASTGKLYLYGGYSGSAMLNDLWEYDIAGNSWSQRTVSGTAFTGSEALAGGYDATNNRFWVSGGWTTNGTFSTSRNNVGYISNIGSSEAYVEVRASETLSGNQAFAGHSFAANIVDPDKGWLVLMSQATPDSTERYNYVIDFAETATSEFPVYGLSDGEHYTARDAMATVWNPDAEEWVQFGGFDDMSDDATIPTGTHSNDVWTYSPTDNRWRYATNGFKAAPQMEGVIAAYDSTRKRILLFSGLTGVQGNANEVWSLTRDAFGNYNAAKLATTGTKPSPRWLGAAVYDLANDRLIVALGGDGSGPTSGVYALGFSGGAGGAWTTLSPSGSVTNVIGMGSANVSKEKRLYIFGGATNSSLTTVSSQTAYFDYSTTNGAWTTITTSGATARRTPAMSYDEGNSRLVVFGGFNGSAVINTTSYFHIGNTTWDNAAPGTLPDARRSTIGEFINGKFYVTGGRTNSGSWFNDTWALTPDYITPNSSTWTNKSPLVYTPMYFTYTGGTANDAYHWQAWATETGVDATKVSFGSNTESFADYRLGTPTVSSPTVTSSAASGVDIDVATANGEVTADGNGSITERGFVLALQSSGDPTTSTNIQKIVATGTTGTFSKQFTKLDPATPYKYRPYAINSNGTSYGSAQNFTSSDYKTFTAYAVMQNVGGGTTSLILYNRTDGTEVAASEMSTTSPYPVLVKKQFAYDATNFTTGKEYEFRPKASSGTTANFWSAGLYIKLKDLTKSTTFNRVSRIGFTALTSAAAATTQRFLYTAANYSSPSVDWIITGTEDGGNGTNNFSLYNVTTTDSGTTGSSVGGTGIDVNSVNKTWATVTGVSLVDTNRYMGIFNYTSGGARYHQGILAITASGAANTVETQTQVELLDVARSSSIQKAYEPQASRTPFSTEHFDGVTYYFEVVGTNSHASNAYGITLVSYDKDGVATDVTTQNLSANTGSSNVRYRTGSITIPTSTVELRVRIAQTAASKNVVLGGARVIAVQTNASKTLVHVPMAGSNVEANDDDLNPLVTTTQTSYSALANNVDQFTIWKRVDANFETYYEAAGSTPQYTKTHTTDALKRGNLTRSHTTSSVMRKQFTLAHTTSSYLKRRLTLTHTTNALLRKQSTLTHTTSANKRKADLTVSHTTSANKKKANNVVSHTTDAFKTKRFTLSHTTDSNKKKADNTVSHTTDVLKRTQNTVSHTTDAYTRIGVQTLDISHTTDSFLRKQQTVSHTTDSFLRKQQTVSHSTSANKRKADNVVSHDTDALKRKANTLSHTTDANKKVANITRSHTTDSFLRKQQTVSHSTDAFKRTQNTLTHTTNSFLRKSSTLSHTTDANKKRAYDVSHTTDALKRTTGNTVTHTTDSLKRTLNTLSHTTDANKRKATTVSHSTDSLLRKSNTISHTTSSNKKKANNVVTHTTDAFKRGRYTVAHTTDARLYVPQFSDIIDNFDDNTLNTAFWEVGSYTQGESGGKAWWSLADTWDDRVRTYPLRSLLGNEFFFKYEAFIVSDTTAIFELLDSTGTMIIQVEHLSTGTVQVKNSSYTPVDSWTFSGTTTNWLRFRESGGTLYIETSGTPSGWTTQYSVSTPSGLATAKFQARGGDAGGDLSKGGISGSIDNFNVGSAQYTVTHTTDALKRKQFTLTHTTDALKRKQTTASHTTDSFLRKQSTVAHTTNTLLRKQTTLTHTTDANKRKANLTLVHTTDANKKKADNTLTHSTDALKRTTSTISHTTNALLRKQSTLSHSTDSFLRTQNIVSHTTSANKRKATVVSHTTDSNKKKANNLVSHTTDALKRKVFTLSHTADTLLRKTNTLSHSTDSFLRRQIALTHTTNAFLRKQNTVAHSTDSNKRKATLVAHTTDTLKRTLNTLTHTTDSLKRTETELTHTTDAFLRTQNTLSHSTDSFLRGASEVYHSTDANKKRAYTVAHSTDANKKKANNVVTHTTDALKRAVGTLTHTTNALLRRQLTATHSTDSFLRRAVSLAHTTDALLRKQNTVSHTTDANKKKANNTVAHTADANKRKVGTVSHTTDALKRTTVTLSHTTDSFLRKQNTVSHSTDANKRKVTTVSHTADAYLRGANSVDHSTDANKKRAGNVVSHTTDTLKRKTNLTVTHTTDSLLREQNVLAHTTDANKRTTGNVVSHTTDANRRKATLVSHTTDANKKLANNTVSHTTDANKRTSGITRTHTTDALLRRAVTLTHTADSFLRKSTAISHTTDALKRTTNTLTHSTDSFLRKANILSHTTDSNKKKASLTVVHTTDANKRTANLTVSHTTSANKRKVNVLTHTTDANKRVAGSTLTHTTSSVLRKTNVVTHATDSFLRTRNQASHTTDSFLRDENELTHTTDANLRKVTTRSHTTSAFLRGANQVVHTTDANKKAAGSVSHTTDASKKIVYTVTHTTNALLRRVSEIAHSTNSFLRKQFTASHSTDSNLKKTQTVAHTTDSALRGGNESSHTTDANLKGSGTVSHTTSANRRKQVLISHTTDAFLRTRVAISHATDSFLRKAQTVLHTTSANKRKANTVSHSTSSNKRDDATVAHTTDAFKRTRHTVTHSTDAFLRKSYTVSHSTSANKKRGQSVAHTTSASLFSANVVQHTTDSYLFAIRGNKKVLVNGQWVYGVVKIKDGSEWRVVPVKVYDGSVWYYTWQ